MTLTRSNKIKLYSCGLACVGVMATAIVGGQIKDAFADAACHGAVESLTYSSRQALAAFAGASDTVPINFVKPNGSIVRCQVPVASLGS